MHRHQQDRSKRACKTPTGRPPIRDRLLGHSPRALLVRQFFPIIDALADIVADFETEFADN
jgi:hypothetical protein